MATVYGGIDIPLANLPGVQAELDVAAARIKQRATELASQHVKSDAYRSSLRTRTDTGPRGVQDRVVESTDPAAVPIEFGHVAKDGSYVIGQFILTRSIG